MKIHEQITKETWCKGSSHKDANGDNLPSYNKAIAKSHCAQGWLSLVYDPDFPVIKLLRELPKGMSIGQWNDHPRRTFEEVKAAFKKADL